MFKHVQAGIRDDLLEICPEGGTGRRIGSGCPEFYERRVYRFFCHVMIESELVLAVCAAFNKVGSEERLERRVIQM
jgi:hypothetical protein